MTPERWAQIEELFHRVAECDPVQRAGLLDGACNGDAELRRELEALLLNERSASDDLEAAVRVGIEAIAFPLVGETISHYRVLDGIGSGGMGLVYRAEDIKLGRRVALKFLPEESTKDPAALERFEREARSASAFEHPNICPIYEFGEQEGQPFLVMQLLEGQTLRELISAAGQGKPPLEFSRLLDLSIQIVDGLDTAHRHGIIHRDIKPANIFVTSQGQAKILDFGLAKLASTGTAAEEESEQNPRDRLRTCGTPHETAARATSDSFLSRTGVAMGTAGYMSPEQVRGDELDARTDLFSFGVVLYEMATGRIAFPGNTAAVIHDAILNRAPIAAVRVNPDLPRKLEEVINKALEKDKKLRYQNAADIHTDLRRLKRDSDSGRAGATTEVESKPATKSIRFRWGMVTAAIIVVIGLAVGGWLFFSRKTRALTEKDTIVLADFTNTTGDAAFDDTLRQGLSVQLEQSPFLSIISDQQIQQSLRMMGQPADAKLTASIARELCLRTGSAAVLDGSIAQIGTQYLLTVKAVNCASGESLASTEAQASDKNHVLDALGKTASEIRNKLGESLSTLQKFDIPLEQATTNSLEALKAFTIGRRTENEKGYAEAVQFDKRAIELDPNFALAYDTLGNDYYSMDEHGLGATYLKKAFDLRNRVTEREKFHITGLYYSIATGELEKSNQTYELWTKVYPRDAAPYINLGNNDIILGKYEKAVTETVESLRLGDWALPYENLGEIYLALNRFDEARTTTEVALGRKLNGVGLQVNLYALAFFRGDVAAMKHQVDWAVGESDGEDQILSLESDTEAWCGRVGKARDLSRQAVERARRNDEKEPAALWQANAAIREALFGNSDASRQNAAATVALAPGSRDAKSQAALAYALAGDTAHAKSLADDLANAFPQDTVVQSVWLPTIRAQIEIDRKKSAESIKLLQAALPYDLGMLSGSAPNSCLYPVYIRAEAYLSARQGQAAATEFKRILDHRGLVWNCATGALAHLGLARANVLQGETVKARAAYQDFLTLWKDADPDIPILMAATAEYAKLQ